MQSYCFPHRDLEVSQSTKLNGRIFLPIASTLSSKQLPCTAWDSISLHFTSLVLQPWASHVKLYLWTTDRDTYLQMFCGRLSQLILWSTWDSYVESIALYHTLTNIVIFLFGPTLHGCKWMLRCATPKSLPCRIVQALLISSHYLYWIPYRYWESLPINLSCLLNSCCSEVLWIASRGAELHCKKVLLAFTYRPLILLFSWVLV